MKNKANQKTNKLRTLWIIICSAFFMAYTCGLATLKACFGTISRTWCDEELQRWVARMIKLFRINVIVVNPHNVTPKNGQATIIMCNHASLMDIPLSLIAFPKNSLRMLAKKELSRIPIMGRGMVAAEFPFIDRHNRKQAMQDLKVVRERLESGIVMWIAPEGTRSKDGTLGAFKKGGFITAIQTQATIIPIGIRGANTIIPAQTFCFNLNQTAEIHIGEPINASDYTLSNKDQLIAKVHHSMENLINAKLT